MPLCHNCPKNREIQKCFRDLKRLRKLCGACEGPSKKPFGKNTHIDAYEDEQLAEKKLKADSVALFNSRQSFASRIAGMDGETADLLKRVLAEFAVLTDEEAPIVVRKLRGETNMEIAHRMGLTKQTVWRRWNMLKRKNPLWCNIENGNEGLRGGGATAKFLNKIDDEPPPEYTQQDLFAGLSQIGKFECKGGESKGQTASYLKIETGFDNGGCTTRKGTHRRFKTGDGRKSP